MRSVSALPSANCEAREENEYKVQHLSQLCCSAALLLCCLACHTHALHAESQAATKGETRKARRHSTPLQRASQKSEYCLMKSQSESCFPAASRKCSRDDCKARLRKNFAFEQSAFPAPASLFSLLQQQLRSTKQHPAKQVRSKRSRIAISEKKPLSEKRRPKEEQLN